MDTETVIAAALAVVAFIELRVRQSVSNALAAVPKRRTDLEGAHSDRDTT